ncbi:2-amino-4-hydroxy-6-hydroxymethyldihydropteridine diphosphokinase [Roseivirga sp. BDSF3-8]|uniref:2-amino-4-hydroxy-6- hydroxymethyldihydropteridine diphosphokinase n=1 Tax=Roseivirga sp. BDSF3-8 TaxID=3241598 RepID=UPI003531A03C
MNGIFLLLGSNLGNRLSNLRLAANLLQGGGCEIVESSKVYETEPWGISEQPAFLNQVLKVETSLLPEELLTLLLASEEEMGRIRHVKWGERLIDMDILYYNDLIYKSESLVVPHPEIANRRFTLVPLAELAGAQAHPFSGLTQEQMLNVCPDKLRVWPHL